jgi:hypothetical protein
MKYEYRNDVLNGTDNGTVFEDPDTGARLPLSKDLWDASDPNNRQGIQYFVRYFGETQLLIDAEVSRTLDFSNAGLLGGPYVACYNESKNGQCHLSWVTFCAL